MMNVLHLINNLRREGAQMVVYHLVTARGSGEVHHLICTREPVGELGSALENRGVPVFSPERYFGLAQTASSLAFLDGVIEDQGVDLIHAHMGDSGFLGCLAARRHEIPLVISHHGHDVLPVCGRACRLVYTFLMRFSARYAAANVAVSDSVSGRVRRVLGVGADKVRVIANGVPVPDDSALKERQGRRDDAFQVVTVGRLVDLKGHEQLIEALPMILEAVPGARVVIVGDGPRRDRLESLARAQGVSGNVFFAGHVDDVSAYLRTADLYVSTSHSEGMPMAVLEAMAWGVPVVASDIPGNLEVVADGKTGTLYPAGRVDALADAILRVRNEASEAAERRRAARRVVAASYSTEAMVRAHEALYRDILRSGSAA